ncbi:hypothetical protein [Mycoplasmoides alvi]|uniref:hypothetical protein n=1 Tax=Mycoplasmoides alvi TaxID=78580 RepID=UPI00051BA5CB|nr:hypothetical protein [Mycoplasmoides alvi]
MQKKRNHRRYYGLFSILGVSVVGLSLLAGLVSSIGLKDDSHVVNSLTNQEATMKPSVIPQSLSSVDVKVTSESFDSGAISADEISDADGNYILTGTNKANTAAKVVKINFQMQYLYDWTYNKQNGYVVRQVVADTDDLGYYYALLVNNNITITANDTSDASNNNDVENNCQKFTLQNPALVVQLYDNGSGFEQRNVYQLQLPDFSINDFSTLSEHHPELGATQIPPISTTSSVEGSAAYQDCLKGTAQDNIWNHVYVEDAITNETTNDELSFIRSMKYTDNSVVGGQSTWHNNIDQSVFVNSNDKHVIYKLLAKTHINDISKSGQDKGNTEDFYILKKLYLNNANNMVYIKDATTNKKMILLFGGNSYQSFWFYDFCVTTNGNATKDVNPLLYANYNFDPTNSTNYYGGDGLYPNVVKRLFYLPFMDRNKVSNLAWYVGGAKTLKITSKDGSSTPYIFLAMMQPNISDYNSRLYFGDSSSSTDSSNAAQVAANTGSSSTSTKTIDQVKQGTYGTSYQVNRFNNTTVNANLDGNTGSTTSNLTAESTNTISMNTSLQKGRNHNDQYLNQEILVGSSSINASYQLLSSEGYESISNGIKSEVVSASSFWFPFTAIQSLTVLPVMTSSIASLIAVDPTVGPQQNMIYMNDFFDKVVDRNNHFALFNCVFRSNKFYKFNFGKKFITLPQTWIKNIDGPKTATNVAPNGNPFNSGNIIVGTDFYGFSRVLTNLNPHPSEVFDNTLGDGLENTASQKILAFSPEITSEVITTSSGDSYNRVSAILIVRGFIYNVSYSFQSLSGVGVVPIADFSKANIVNINPNQHINDVSNLLSISYSDNNWIISYQDPTKKKHAFYSLKLDQNNNLTFSKNRDLSFININNNDVTKVIAKGVSSCFTFSISGNSGEQVDFINTSNLVSTDNGNTQLQGGTIIDNWSVWGKVDRVNDQYLIDSGLIKQTPKKIMNSPGLLNQLITYTGGWSYDPLTQQTFAKPKIINPRVEGSSLVFDVALMYVNGIYYTSAQFDSKEYPNVVYDATLATPSFKFDGFSPMEPWVLPVVISISVVLTLVLISVGIGIPLSIKRDHKLTQKGFSSTNKKVDTLKSAVGNVYNKVIVQTKNNKQWQMLKSSNNKAPNLKSKSTVPSFPSKPTGPSKLVSGLEKSISPKKPN